MTHTLITGANRGLGLEFARQLLARGERVITCCREPGRAHELRALARDEGSAPRLTLRALDVADDGALAALPGWLEAEGLTVETLINNAGIAAPQETFGHCEAETMRRVLHVNAVAPLLLAQALAPAMKPGRGGLPPRIVCVSSDLGSIARAGDFTYGLSYGVSKAALNMGVKKLGGEMRARGVAIVALHPGWVQTDMGGPQATLRPAESVRAMLEVIGALGVADSGRFLDYEGRDLPW